MYPKNFIESFRSFTRSSEVFVAMPFAETFEDRWEGVFQPAIIKAGLQPYRVDIRQVSDSILTDILAGISRARLILVDTSFQSLSDRPAGPNANVMYEMGIAQATRLPEEVIVVRDTVSSDSVPFDIGHIRYQSFNAEDKAEAIKLIHSLISAALSSIDLLKDQIITKVFEALDPDSMQFLGVVGSMEQFDLYPFDPDRKGLYGLPFRDSSEVELREIARHLINLGILVAGDPGPRKAQVYGAVQEYMVTDLGRAAYERLPAGYINPPEWLET